MAGEQILVVGGGHNGLVAAVLAARSGYRVTLLEAADRLGGATVGDRVFAGQPARLSRYSYLVSLFPQALIARLGIAVPLASRRVSSYTPTRRAGRDTGLLVERRPGPETAESFRELTGSAVEFASWQRLQHDLAAVAVAVSPALSGPLRRRSQVRDDVRAAVGTAVWDDLVEVPIGELICRRLSDDLVRGVVATDALIGTHADLFGHDLLANRCFLYHVIGRGTGEWLVPVGGMGAVADELIRAARAAGVEIRLRTEVSAVSADDRSVEVRTVDGAGYRGSRLLAAVAPATIAGWLGTPAEPPVGSQLKINMLLDRLPRFASGLGPEVGFAGTTHLAEGFEQLQQAFSLSAAGRLPDPLPAEVYCHSLTDPSIMNGHGGATLTLFGLHTPVSLFRADPLGVRDQAVRLALHSLQRYLAEPLKDCLARDAAGRPCLDVATPVDLQDRLRMPGGHIFHGDLSWPWLPADADPSDPAVRYGVEVPGCPRILLAGAGSRRGGGVSGLGGQAAVDALLALDRTGATMTA